VPNTFQPVRVCHYEPSQGWLLESKAAYPGYKELPYGGPSDAHPLGDYRPVAGGVCSVPLVVVATPKLIATPPLVVLQVTDTPVPAALPSPTATPEAPTSESASTPTLAPASTPTVTPTIFVTPAPPPAGDGQACLMLGTCFELVP
jgi:hypothetical protein